MSFFIPGLPDKLCCSLPRLYDTAGGGGLSNMHLAILIALCFYRIVSSLCYIAEISRLASVYNPVEMHIPV